MNHDDNIKPCPPSLDAYRSSKQQENHIRRAIDKTQVLRDLLGQGLKAVNTGSSPERQIVAFALGDLLAQISRDDLEYFNGLLRRVRAGLIED